MLPHHFQQRKEKKPISGRGKSWKDSSSIFLMILLHAVLHRFLLTISPAPVKKGSRCWQAEVLLTLSKMKIMTSEISTVQQGDGRVIVALWQLCHICWYYSILLLPVVILDKKDIMIILKEATTIVIWANAPLGPLGPVLLHFQSTITFKVGRHCSKWSCSSWPSAADSTELEPFALSVLRCRCSCTIFA